MKRYRSSSTPNPPPPHPQACSFARPLFRSLVRSAPGNGKENEALKYTIHFKEQGLPGVRNHVSILNVQDFLAESNDEVTKVFFSKKPGVYFNTYKQISW